MRCKKIFSCVCVLLLLVLVACQDGKNKVGPIAKITIDGKKPIGGIKENMNFGVTNAKKVKVEVETSSKDLVVTYTPALQDGLWNLVLEKENELTISVKGSGNPTVYKAKITHEIEHNFGEEVDKDIIDFLQIEGLAVDENVQTVPDEQTGRILKGQDEIIELTGPFAIIRLGHKDNEDGTPYTATKLKTVKVNSVDMIKTSFPQVTSAFAKGVEMPLNDVLDVKIEAETEDGKKTNVVFKIRRVEGTVDIPSMYMYVEEDAMIEDSYPLNFLTKGDGQGKFPLFDGDEPTKVRIGVLYDGLIESIEIDGESRKPEEKPIKIKKDGKEIDKWYCVEKSITGIAPNGKDVVIKVTPIDKTEFTTTTLKFSFFYKPPKDNADFMRGEAGPLYDEEVKWYDNTKGVHAVDDYGAKSVTLSMFTKVATTKVYYQKIFLFVDEDSSGEEHIKNEIKIGTPQLATFSDNSSDPDKHKRFKHTAKDIQLDADQPTILRFWTVSESGKTDDGKGRHDFGYNTITCRWDYAKKSKGKEFAEHVYNEIKVDKTKVQNQKIYVTFKVYDEKAGHKVDNTKITQSYQKPFEEIEKINSSHWMCSEIDVSTLLQGSANELDIVLPVLGQQQKDSGGNYTGEFHECFTYKVKVKLQ